MPILLASSYLWAPSDFDSSAFTPTPVPVATAMMSVCKGKASETAVSAFSDSFATKILSTMLYRACTSMEIIIGKDMLNTSLPIGMVPILFSVTGAEFVSWLIIPPIVNDC